MCLVNPYVHLREDLANNNQDKVIEVFLQSSRDLRKEYHVEDFEIGDPEHILLTDESIEQSWENLKDLLNLMTVTDIIKGDEINISATEWKRLNGQYSKEEIKQMISDAIRDNDLPMPMRELSLLDAKQDFLKLQALEPSSIIVNEQWFTSL